MDYDNFNKKVILLNYDNDFIHFIKVKKAVSLLVKGKATLLESIMIKISNNCVTIVPKSIRLNSDAGIKDKKLKWNNKNVFVRDMYTCVYCGKKNLKGIDCTIDHILPKSKGGKNTFENTVCCCKNCNNSIKRNMTLNECGLYFKNPKFKPYHLNLKTYLKNIEKLHKIY